MNCQIVKIIFSLKNMRPVKQMTQDRACVFFLRNILSLRINEHGELYRGNTHLSFGVI